MERMQPMPDTYPIWFDSAGQHLARLTEALAPTSWAIVLTEITGLGIILAIGHRIATAVWRRMSSRLPFSRRMVEYGHRSGMIVLFLYCVLMLLHAAPDTLSFIVLARRLDLLALVGAATWLGVRWVRAVADTVVEINPDTAATNIEARRIRTQAKVLSHTASALIILVGLGLAFSTMPLMRQIGTTFLASAGVAGLVLGFAAKPLLGNLLAGVQLALTQAIRLGDVVIVEQEWGWIEEITGTYVVVKIWDERRLIVPLQWFIEHSFQNWTRNQTAILGTIMLWTDYRMPVDPIRREAERLCRDAPEWNHEVCATQVVETTDRAMQLRILVSAGDAGQSWDLRCRIREGLVDFIQREYPQYLPRVRTDVVPPEVRGDQLRADHA